MLHLQAKQFKHGGWQAVLRGLRDPRVWSELSPLFIFTAIGLDTEHRPAWLNLTFQALWILFFVALLVQGVTVLHRFLRRPFVALNYSGLSWSLKNGGAATPWAQIEACACKNDGKDAILRIFLRDRAEPAGRRDFIAAARRQARVVSGRHHFDIDFALADQPGRSLAEASEACAAWIASTRGVSAPEAIRDFVDDRPARSAPRRPLFGGAAGVVAFSVLFIGVAGFVAYKLRRPLYEEPPMAVDDRPEFSVLLIGNSRTYSNNLPKIVRDVADSAQAPIRYDLHMRAWPYAGIKDFWRDEGDREALKKPWGLVVIQAESNAFLSDFSAEDFDDYGAELIRAGRAGGSRVALIANWTLAADYLDDDPASPKAYGALIERKTRALAEREGAEVIDLNAAFADAAASAPEIALTSDGNQPSHAGSYLAALVIYGYLSHAELAPVRWRPFDMSLDAANKLKAVAARHAR